MRALFICALAASLAGCGCYLSPDTQACTGFNGSGFACYDRHADLRLSQATEPDPAASEPDSAIPKGRSKLAARKVKPASANGGDAIQHPAREEKPATSAVNMETPEWVQRLQASDPVIAKAKTAVAAKLENPASATFAEMYRSMRKNTMGQSVDTICGHVKGKKASGEDIGDRPFLYLVKAEEAYVADGSPNSEASTAYRNICN